jgi:Dyp-type peroxidase family
VVDLDNTSPLEESKSPADQWLPTLQGNILGFHGRAYADHLFFSFRPEASVADRRATLRALAERFVTSAVVQRRQTDRYKQWLAERGDPPAAAASTAAIDVLRPPLEPFGHLALSACGYQGLGYKDVGAIFPEPPDPDGSGTAISSFADGMRTTAHQDFGDDLTAWEPAYRSDDKPLAGVLILAGNDRGVLDGLVRVAGAVLDTTCEVVATERGHILRHPVTRQGLEPFGFVDGRSQPLFLARDFRQEPACPQHWDGFAPLRLALIRDPLMPGDDRCHGSFLVYRKLEQDVPGFLAALADLARTLPGGDVAMAGALVVGRFADGTPLTVYGSPQGAPLAHNDFDYFDDFAGSRCPFQAHVRKVNPRGSGHKKDLAGHRLRRLVRRGLVYGLEKPAPPVPRLGGGVGLLFMCYQASVRNQFAFVQKTWSNTATFPRGDVGVDAITGSGNRRVHSWPTSWNANARQKAEFAPFVHVRGGEYFFAPSIPFLKTL